MTGSRGAIHSPERNRFFYGKVMDVRQWRMEQEYGIESRTLLSRLGLGVGVLSGLSVEPAFDGSSIVVRAGVAIDERGRTIVVPVDVTIESPDQPTDCRGAPDGDVVTDGLVTLQLCYHECLTESVPAIACGCDTVERCEASVVCERYRFQIVRGAPEPADPVACPAMFPTDAPAEFSRRRAIWETLSAAPIPPPWDGEPDPCGCIVLATMSFSPDGAATIDPFTYRRTIYSNQALLELILCLAERVDQCCNEHPEPASPPRVMRMWPTDRAVLDEGLDAERQHWLKAPRLEIAFERTIADSILDRPEDWLRAWSFVPVDGRIVARRIDLTREVGGQPSILGAVGLEQVATYLLDGRYREELDVARVLVQLRPEPSGVPVVVDGSTPPLALDGEHHGTALDQAALDHLWTSVDGTRKVVDPGWWDALVAAVPTPLPSGDGSPGGALDTAFMFSRPRRPEQPRLQAIWPPSSIFLTPRANRREVQVWWRDFREVPHLELTFDDSVDPNKLASLAIDEWIRLWWLPNPEVDAIARRLPLGWGDLEPQPHLNVPGTTVRIVMEVPFADFMSDQANHIVWMLRGDVAAVDADFDGLQFDRDALDVLWNEDRWPGGVPGGPSSEGVALHDGSPGGTLSAYFDYMERG